MRRLILIPFLIVIAVLAIAGGIGYYLYYAYMYYQTDDAQVTSHIVAINAPVTGTVASLTVKQNDTVTAGQTIGTLAPASTAANGASNPSIPLNSPITGTILQIAALPHQVVTPGLPLVQVTDLSAVTVTAFIDEGRLKDISIGQAVDISIDAYPGTSFTGHVNQIVQATASQFSLLPTQDNASGNFTKVSQRIPVIITLDGNAGKKLLPGMSAEVSIHLH